MGPARFHCATLLVEYLPGIIKILKKRDFCFNFFRPANSLFSIGIHFFLIQRLHLLKNMVLVQLYSTIACKVQVF